MKLSQTNFSQFLNNDYMNENESCASTNKDSNLASSKKGNRFYDFLMNINIIKRNNEYEDFKFDGKNPKINNIKNKRRINRLVNKVYKDENNKNSSTMNYKSNYYPKSYSINKTMNILDLNLKNANFKRNIQF